MGPKQKRVISFRRIRGEKAPALLEKRLHVRVQNWSQGIVKRGGRGHPQGRGGEVERQDERKHDCGSANPG